MIFLALPLLPNWYSFPKYSVKIFHILPVFPPLPPYICVFSKSSPKFVNAKNAIGIREKIIFINEGHIS